MLFSQDLFRPNYLNSLKIQPFQTISLDLQVVSSPGQRCTQGRLLTEYHSRLLPHQQHENEKLDNYLPSDSDAVDRHSNDSTITDSPCCKNSL